MKKKKSESRATTIIYRYVPILFTILVTIFSILIFYIAKGYTFDIYNKEILKNGAIYIKSSPSGANILLNGKSLGKSPKSKIVTVGNYKLEMEKDGYNKWEKDIKILEERSTILNPWLILKDIKRNTVWSSEKSLENLWVSEEKNIALILLKEPTGEYSLWRYRIERAIWDISDNPSKIWDTTNADINILLAPNGSYALLTINKSSDPSYYLLNTSTSFTPTLANSIDTDKIKGSKVTWARDSKHILIESDKQIISYSITDKLAYNLINKIKDVNYIWTSSYDSYFYIVNKQEERYPGIYTYSMNSIFLDGAAETPFITEINLQKDLRYIEYYRADLQKEKAIPFTNSPQSTQSVGEIKSIYIDKNAGGFFISTTAAAYWYDVQSRTYLMISPYPAEFLEFSADKTFLMYESMEKIYTFTIKKVALDHTNEIGSLLFPNITKGEAPKLINNSPYISYIADGTIYFMDRDGDNKTKIIPSSLIDFYMVKFSKDALLTFEKDDMGLFHINEYRLQ